MKTIGLTLLVLVTASAVAAPFLSPHDSAERWADHLFAPPMRLHLVDERGQWHRPFVYAWRLVSRLEQRYEEDRSRTIPLRWFSGGKLVQAGDERHTPLLLLGADSFGRDVFGRLLYGARLSLGLACVSALGAMLIGVLVGALAGYVGGAVDEILMRFTEFVLVLPAIYVILAIRAVLPLVLPPAAVFLLMTAIFALVGWPFVARGVRGIVAAECQREYATAALSLGAGPLRVLARHVLPATTGFLSVQATLLVPGFILAEATLSYVGLGFPDQSPSWGAMLHEASNVSALADFPWTLSPAVAMFVVVLALNMLVQSAGENPASALYLGRIKARRGH